MIETVTRCLSDETVASIIVRAPHDGHAVYRSIIIMTISFILIKNRQLYEAESWMYDPLYQCYMMKIVVGNIFVQDIIKYDDSALGTVLARIERLYYDVCRLLCIHFSFNN